MLYHNIIMFKKTFLLAFLFFSLGLFVSCDFLENELNLRSSSRSKGTVSTITVTANAAWKNKAESDPPLTYVYDPNPLPDGVSLTGVLARDPGEDAGTYVIRQGTIELTGNNAGKYTLKYIGSVFSIYEVNP